MAQKNKAILCNELGAGKSPTRGSIITRGWRFESHARLIAYVAGERVAFCQRASSQLLFLDRLITIRLLVRPLPVSEGLASRCHCFQVQKPGALFFPFPIPISHLPLLIPKYLVLQPGSLYGASVLCKSSGSLGGGGVSTKQVLMSSPTWIFPFSCPTRPADSFAGRQLSPFCRLISHNAAKL